MPKKMKEMSVVSSTQDETDKSVPASRRKPQRNWRNLSMVTKMTILMSALIMLACVAGGVLSYLASSQIIEREVNFTGSQVVRSISSAISTEMLNLPLDDKRQKSLTNIRTILNKLLSSDKEGRIEDAFILDKAKEDDSGKKSYSIIAAKNEARIGGNFELPNLLNGLTDLKQVTSLDKALVVASPVKFGKNHVGYVVITFNNKSLEKARNSIFFAFLMVFLAAFAITVLATRFAIKYQLKPVIELGKAAQEFADGNYDYSLERMEGGDEIATTYNAFGGMGKNLQTAFQFCPVGLNRKIASGKLIAAEGKNLTIVFGDGVGSTKWSRAYEARRIVSMLTEYFTIIGRIIDRMGGFVDKTMGDGILCYFGLDQSPREASRSAVRAVICIQHVIAFVNYAFQKYHSRLPLRFRFAIASGRCSVGPMGARGVKMDYTIIGDAVNVAAKLEGKAPVGGLLVDNYTYQNCGEGHVATREPEVINVEENDVDTRSVNKHENPDEASVDRTIILDIIQSEEMGEILSLSDEDYMEFILFVTTELNDKEPTTPAPDYMESVM